MYGIALNPLQMAHTDRETLGSIFLCLAENEALVEGLVRPPEPATRWHRLIGLQQRDRSQQTRLEDSRAASGLAPHHRVEQLRSLESRCVQVVQRIPKAIPETREEVGLSKNANVSGFCLVVSWIPHAEYGIMTVRVVRSNRRTFGWQEVPS